MKKKFGLFALVLTVLLCGSLFLFAACGDGEEEEPSATPAISVTVNETARQSGATIEGDTEDTYTIAASVVNGEEGASVTISYVYESGEAETFTGSTFSPREAGTYVFTFTAEGASNFTLTFEIAEAQAPVHEHTYGAWDVTAPTADAAGQAVRTCGECAEGTDGKTQTVTLPALNSTEAATAYTSNEKTPATCTDPAVTTYTYTADNTIAFDITGEVSYEQSAHTALAYVAAVAPTCTEAGTIAHAYCEDCGKYYNVTGDASDYTIGAEIANGAAGLTGDPATGHSATVSVAFADYLTGNSSDYTWTKAVEATCGSCDGTVTLTVDTLEAETFTYSSTDGTLVAMIEQGNDTVKVTVTGVPAPVTPVITLSVTLGGKPVEGVENGGEIYACIDTEIEYTAMVTGGGAVAITYVYESEEEKTLDSATGTFTFDKIGEYVFTFAAEGAKPVTVTVTVTAAHEHTYGAWTVTAPTADTAGQAVRTCGECAEGTDGKTQTVTLPALKSTEAATAYTSNVKTSATCTDPAVTTYTYTADNTIAFDITGKVSHEQSAHTALAYVAAVAPTCTEAGKIAHAYCEDCGKYYNVTGDASDYTIGAEIADGAAGLTGDPATGHSATVSVAFADYLTGDSSDYTWTKAVEATCGTCQTKVTLAVDTLEAATFTYSSAEATLVGTIEQGNDTVTVTVTDVPEPVTPVITLSVTLGGEPVKGVENGGEIYACIDTEIEYTATVMGGGAVAITYVYESEEEKALDSATGTFTFDKIGEYVFTLKADSAVDYTFKVNIIAHEGAYAYSAEKQVVVFTCKNCGTAIDCAITGITVTGDAGSAYVVDNGDETYTAYGFKVEAVYAGVDGNPVTEIVIPLSDENLAVSSVSGGYKAASVTFTYNSGVSDATDDAAYTVYTVAKTTGNVDAQEGTEWQPKIVDLGADAGEYEYRFVLNMTDRSASNVYNSWVLTLVPANGSTDAAVRPDNYIITNFGRGNGNGTGEATGFTFTTNTDMTKGAEKYLNGFDYAEEGALYFVVTRTFTEGAYKLTISVTQGEYSSTYVVDEPATVGNGLNIWLGSDHAAYTYSDILYVSKGLTVSSISANPTEVEVAGGTTLEAALANVSVTVSYGEGALTDTVAATACSHEGEYDAATSDTYPITLTYGGKTTTVNVIVNAEHVHDFVDGICECGARLVTAVSNEVTYTGILTSTPITNNDADGNWWNGSTSNIAMADNSAAIITWENTRDGNYYDYAVELVFNLGGKVGEDADGQFIDFDPTNQWAAEWVSATTPTMNGSTTGSQGTAGDTNAGYGTYVATVTRIGDTVTVTVAFTANGSDVVTWTRTATATGCPTGAAIQLRIAGNPYFLDNFAAYYGTLEAQS